MGLFQGYPKKPVSFLLLSSSSSPLCPYPHPRLLPQSTSSPHLSKWAVPVFDLTSPFCINSTHSFLCLTCLLSLSFCSPSSTYQNSFLSPLCLALLLLFFLHCASLPFIIPLLTPCLASPCPSLALGQKVEGRGGASNPSLLPLLYFWLLLCFLLKHPLPL